MEKSEDKVINILFVLPNFDTGGSEKLVVEIIKNINKEDFSPVLCVFFSGKYEEEFLKLNIPFYVIHKDKIISKFQVAQYISNIVRKHKINVVNTHHCSPLVQGVVPFKIMNRAKWLHTEHTLIDLDPNVNAKIKFLMRVAIAFVDKAIGISQAVCDDFQKTLKISEKKVIKILNGVDVEKFKKAENREENIEKRKELGIEDNTIVIGMFANFRKQKNHECLLRAIALLQEKIENREEKIDDRKQAMENGMVKSEDRERIKKDKKRFEKKCAPPSIFNFPYSFKIVLAGNGPEWKNIKQLSANLELDNCMMFLGPRLDIPELMNMIDIYCLPSRFEGLPFSLIEAMAAGKALVATDVIGNREVIENKKNGLLVKDNNSEDLANRLLELLKSEELREQLGKKAFEDSYKYSFDEMMRTYEAIFKKTTDEKKIEQPF